MAALSLLPASAEATRPAAAAAQAKAGTPLEQAKQITQGLMDAMDSMAGALEKTKDEKSAKLAAAEILTTTEKLQKFAKAGRELKSKLTEDDKIALEKAMEKFDMAQYRERITKAFAALADKPEVMEILTPALSGFGVAAMTMAAEEAGEGEVIRARDKGVPPRLRDNGAQVPPQKPKSLVE